MIEDQPEKPNDELSKIINNISIDWDRILTINKEFDFSISLDPIKGWVCTELTHWPPQTNREKFLKELDIEMLKLNNMRKQIEEWNEIPVCEL